MKHDAVCALSLQHTGRTQEVKHAFSDQKTFQYVLKSIRKYVGNVFIPGFKLSKFYKMLWQKLAGGRV